MIFRTYGPFKVAEKEVGYIDRNQPRLWQETEDERSGLADACGCYVFGVKASLGQTPWYIGQANCQSFRKEVFAPTKLNHYTRVALGYERGTPLIYLVARVTKTDKFSPPSRTGYRDIDALEQILIEQALRKNPDLCNSKNTMMLRELKVHGLMNAKPGKPENSAAELKVMLGLAESL